MKITHPQALAAIWLAHKLNGAPSNVVTAVLNASGIPRDLFVLASILRAEAMGKPVLEDVA